MGAFFSSLFTSPALTASGAGLLAFYFLYLKPKPFTPKKHAINVHLNHGVLDVRRKAQIAYARASDHVGEVIVAPAVDFDLNKTIFGVVEGAFKRYWLKDRLAVELFWSDESARRVEEAYRTIPAPPSHAQALVEFMQTDCDFSMEHADGSFMDHLRFCYEYSNAHYKKVSPRVLLLHSIMGVGTNFFPMKADKIPKLKSLLTQNEFMHVEAFPSVLRLIYHRRLLEELRTNDAAQLAQLKSIQMHRVIDNAPLTLSATDLWTALNLQVVHLLDFLPAADWKSNMDDFFLCNFKELHDFLSSNGLLQATVDYDLKQAGAGSDGKPLTLAKVIRNLLPPDVVAKKIPAKNMERFSTLIGHSLDYTLVWK